MRDGMKKKTVTGSMRRQELDRRFTRISSRANVKIYVIRDVDGLADKYFEFDSGENIKLISDAGAKNFRVLNNIVGQIEDHITLRVETKDGVERSIGFVIQEINRRLEFEHEIYRNDVIERGHGPSVDYLVTVSHIVKVKPDLETEM